MRVKAAVIVPPGIAGKPLGTYTAVRAVLDRLKEVRGIDQIFIVNFDSVVMLVDEAEVVVPEKCKKDAPAKHPKMQFLGVNANDGRRFVGRTYDALHEEGTVLLCVNAATPCLLAQTIESCLVAVTRKRHDFCITSRKMLAWSGNFAKVYSEQLIPQMGVCVLTGAGVKANNPAFRELSTIEALDFNMPADSAIINSLESSGHLM